MKSTTSPNRGAAIGEGSKTFDVERLDWGYSANGLSWPKKYLRLLKPRKQSVYLFLIDITIIGTLVLIFQPLITLLLRNEELFGARLTLPLDEAPENNTPAEHKIPRILHQTSATDKIPANWTASVQTCKDSYADWEYMVRFSFLARTCLLLTYPRSYGPTRPRETLSPPSTPRLLRFGITSTSPSNAPMPFDTLFSTILAVSTLTWIQSATTLFPSTRSKPTASLTMLSSSRQHLQEFPTIS